MIPQDDIIYIDISPFLHVSEDSAHSLDVFVSITTGAHTNISAVEVGGFNSQSSESETVVAPSDLVGKKRMTGGKKEQCQISIKTCSYI